MHHMKPIIVLLLLSLLLFAFTHAATAAVAAAAPHQEDAVPMSVGLSDTHKSATQDETSPKSAPTDQHKHASDPAPTAPPTGLEAQPEPQSEPSLVDQAMQHLLDHDPLDAWSDEIAAGRDSAVDLFDRARQWAHGQFEELSGGFTSLFDHDDDEDDDDDDWASFRSLHRSPFVSRRQRLMERRRRANTRKGSPIRQLLKHAQALQHRVLGADGSSRPRKSNQVAGIVDPVVDAVARTHSTGGSNLARRGLGALRIRSAADGKRLEAQIELPSGLKVGDLKVRLQNEADGRQLLRIEGSHSEKHADANQARQSSTSFVRVASLPRRVDPRSVKATVDKDGTLRIELPVALPEKPRVEEIDVRQIEQ